MNEALLGRAGAAAAVSRAFVAARRAALPLDDFPGTLPTTLADAYAVQGLSIAAWPDMIAGWKIGMVPAPYRGDFEDVRLAGPIFSKTIRHAGPGDVVEMGVYDGGFGAVEAEFLFRLGADAAMSGGPATREEADALVAAMHVGVEIASSPLQAINDIGPMSIISDFGNNAGLVVGPEIANWRDIPLNELTAEVEIDGAVVGSATAASILDGPIAALQFLIDKCRLRKIPLRAGAWVSTGAVTGVHEAGPGARSRVDFGRFGAIDLALTAIPAEE